MGKNLTNDKRFQGVAKLRKSTRSLEELGVSLDAATRVFIDVGIPTGLELCLRDFKDTVDELYEESVLKNLLQPAVQNTYNQKIADSIAGIKEEQQNQQNLLAILKEDYGEKTLAQDKTINALRKFVEDSSASLSKTMICRHELLFSLQNEIKLKASLRDSAINERLSFLEDNLDSLNSHVKHLDSHVWNVLSREHDYDDNSGDCEPQNGWSVQDRVNDEQAQRLERLEAQNKILLSKLAEIPGFKIDEEAGPGREAGPGSENREDESGSEKREDGARSENGEDGARSENGDGSGSENGWMDGSGSEKEEDGPDSENEEDSDFVDNSDSDVGNRIRRRLIDPQTYRLESLEAENAAFKSIIDKLSSEVAMLKSRTRRLAEI